MHNYVLCRFVIVTAEYNCSLPPALTNLLDYFPPASFRQIDINRIFTKIMNSHEKIPILTFRHKPVSIAAYSMGPFGGIRAAQLARYRMLCALKILKSTLIGQLLRLNNYLLHRPFLSELGLVPLPSTLLIPTVQVLKSL